MEMRECQGDYTECLNADSMKEEIEEMQRYNRMAAEAASFSRERISDLDAAVTYWIAEGDKIRGKLNEALDQQVRIGDVRNKEIHMQALEIDRLRETIEGLCDRG